MISERVRNLKPSATLEINKKAKELKAKGVDVINLSVGEPDFDTPEPIKDFAIKVIKEGFTKYTDTAGIQELREAISNKLEKENGLSYSPSQIVVSNGAKHSLYNIFLAILDPGDEVIIPAPYWVSYPEMVCLAGGVPVFCRWDKNFKMDMEHLKFLINRKTKALILNSPSNPTGIVYEKAEIDSIAEMLIKSNILCISDEVYEKIIYDGKKYVSIASHSSEMKRNTVIVNAVSKTFAMTGWRIGYIAAEKEIADAVSKIQGQTTSAPSSISQKAAVFAIKEGQALYSEMVNEFQKRRDFLLKNLPEEFFYPVPMGAFYLFFSYNEMDSLTLCKQLLEEKYLAAVPGVEFGADKFIRISYATSMKNLEITVDRLNDFVRENK
ncbi:MAG: pyridoxal phosphate-dependent aminotransferase [Candidatus Omnitrophica bacterium]|nr:pyridoxal phosphate-dependent aminotransferase [Candidatus Omnitrophota bacterium]MCM8776907.1 pyridoxal phosphate-dependent aminotransferase [Candidatus Omnitrophota bacterium]